MDERAKNASVAEDRKLRVFVVDDSPVMIQAIRRVVEAMPQLELVGTSDSAIEAMDVIDRIHPQVVLMDIRMPNMNGLEATRRLCHDHPDIRVIIVTGMDSEVRRLCELAGASGFVCKPRLHQDLPSEVARLFKEETYPKDMELP
jgi:DNA-binding NarL/FixJ family response regulator